MSLIQETVLPPGPVDSTVLNIILAELYNAIRVLRGATPGTSANPAVHASRASAQSIPNGPAYTSISWETIEHQQGQTFLASVPAATVVLPSAGWYVVSFAAVLAGGGTKDIQVTLDGVQFREWLGEVPSTNGMYSMLVRTESNDVDMLIKVKHGSGSNQNLSSAELLITYLHS